MMTRLLSVRSIFILIAAVMGFTACKKEVSTIATTSTSTNSISASSTIVLPAGQNSTTGSAGDSVYVVHPCDEGSQLDSIAQSGLPATVSTYLTTTYPGYTFNRAFVVKDSLGNVKGYVAVIFYNGIPVAVLFDASGNFVRVLEQREKGDINGPGYHEGGRFSNRDGLQKDTVAFSALPTNIVSYFSANYPQDTLVKAFKDSIDGNYVVISKNNGLFANVFDLNGNFLKRVAIPAPQGGSFISILQSVLPANVSGYLNTTYPNYVFNKVFSVSINNVVQGYVVIINANNTKYAVVFDAGGNFVLVKTIW